MINNCYLQLYYLILFKGAKYFYTAPFNDGGRSEDTGTISTGSQGDILDLKASSQAVAEDSASFPVFNMCLVSAKQKFSLRYLLNLA